MLLGESGFVEEVLHDLQAFALASEYCRVRYPNIGEPDVGVVGGHIECPEIFKNLKARGVGWH